MVEFTTNLSTCKFLQTLTLHAGKSVTNHYSNLSLQTEFNHLQNFCKFVNEFATEKYIHKHICKFNANLCK